MKILLALFATVGFISCAHAASMLTPFTESGGKTTDEIAKFNSIIDGLTVRDLQSGHIDTKLFLDPRIFGGAPADIKDSPWQVVLVFGIYQDPLRAPFCGGSIIGNDWVVTAAHCVVNDSINMNPSKLDLVANTSFYSTGGDRVKIREVYVHENYNPDTLDSDIALLRLDTHSAILKAIALPDKHLTISVGTKLLVTGWGSSTEGGRETPYLVGANIPVVSNKTCNSPKSYDGKVTADQFCAGLRDGGLDSCQGDSGGPAVATSTDGPILLGIISGGVGCARRYKYGVYADVRVFRDWIDGKISK